MNTWSNTNKSNTATPSNQPKSTTSYGAINQVKAGLGWLYDQAGITYDGMTDPVSGNTVYYDGLGVVTVWVTENES